MARNIYSTQNPYNDDPISSRGFAVAPPDDTSGDASIGNAIGGILGKGLQYLTYDPENDPRAQQARYYGAKTREADDGLQSASTFRDLARSHAAEIGDAVRSGDPDKVKAAIQNVSADAISRGYTDSKSIAGLGATIGALVPGAGDAIRTSMQTLQTGQPLGKDSSFTTQRQDQLRTEDFGHDTDVHTATNASEERRGAATNASNERRTGAEVAGRQTVEGMKLDAEPKKPLIVPAGATATTPTGEVIYTSPDHEAKLKEQAEVARTLPFTIAQYIPGAVKSDGSISDDPTTQGIISAAAPKVMQYREDGLDLAGAVVKAIDQVSKPVNKSTWFGLGSGRTTRELTPTPADAAAAPAPAPAAPSSIQVPIAPQAAAPAASAPAPAAPAAMPAPEARPDGMPTVGKDGKSYRWNKALGGWELAA